MLLNEFLKHALVTLGKANSEDLDMLLGAEALKDETLQIPDDAVEQFNENILPKQRLIGEAKKSEPIRKYFYGSILDEVDKVLEEVSGDVGIEVEGENTIEKFKDALTKIKSLKSNAENPSELQKHYDEAQAKLKSMNQELTKVQQESEEKINSLKNSYIAERNNERVKIKLLSYDLTANFPGGEHGKKVFADAFIDQVRSKYTIKEEQGSLGLFDKDNPDEPAYDEKHNRVVLDNLMQDYVQPFTVKQDAKPGNGKPSGKSLPDMNTIEGIRRQKFELTKQ